MSKKKMALVGAMMVVAGVVSADVLTRDNSATFIPTITDGGSTAKALINASGGDLNWDIGETFGMTFDLAVTNPDPSTGGGSTTIIVGIGDNSEALGFGLGMWDSRDFVAAGIDNDAPGAGNFGISVGSSSPRIDFAVAAANDLRQTGESASFAMTVLRADIDTYDFSVTWAGVVNTWSIDAATTGTGDTVDTFHEVMLRVNDGTAQTTDTVGLTNLSMTVIPEPATLGLVGVAGIAILGVRRFMRI